MPIYDSTSDPCAQESSLNILKDLNSLTSLNRKLQKLRALCCDLSRDEFPKGVFMVVVVGRALDTQRINQLLQTVIDLFSIFVSISHLNHSFFTT